MPLGSSPRLRFDRLVLIMFGYLRQRFQRFWVIGSHRSRRRWLVEPIRPWIGLELFDTQGYPLHFRLYVQDHHFDRIANTVMGDCFLTRDRPVKITQVNNSIDSSIKGSKESDVTNDTRYRTRDSFIASMLSVERFPGVTLTHDQFDSPS